jgi:nucleotide-binding universal stress UspA family protein
VTQYPIKTIIHPTDFSDASAKAFAHAMAFSLAAQSRLYILHVAKDRENRDLYSQPHVRELLASWGKMNPQELPEAIPARTGVQVSKIAMRPGDLRQRIDKFITSHECDLMVLATHHRTALMRLVSGSVAAGVYEDSRVPTLFLRDDLDGFIDLRTGSCQLETLLIPIGPEVRAEAIEHIEAIVKLIAPRIRIKRLHVGTQQPVVIYKGDQHRSMQIEVRNDSVVETIVHAAAKIGAGLIAMPTEGTHGLSDALLGTTTERVLREAPCPVLALPMPRNSLLARHPSGTVSKSKEVFPTDEHTKDDLPSTVAHVVENVEHTISDIALGFHLAHWHPISTAPCNQSLELRVAEGDDMVTVQFPCCRTNDTASRRILTARRCRILRVSNTARIEKSSLRGIIRRRAGEDGAQRRSGAIEGTSAPRDYHGAKNPDAPGGTIPLRCPPGPSGASTCRSRCCRSSSA